MALQPRILSSSANLNVMCSAAFKAAKGLIRDFGEVEHLQVSKKGPGDFVSVADKRAEDIIYRELSKARPHVGFLMEERGEIKGESDEYWIVDPLDGTTNFLHAVPHFAISIALVKGSQVIAGVIYDPIKDEMFMAEKGSGAFLNDKRLRVSGRQDLSTALLATGIPFASHTPEERKRFQKTLDVVMPQVAGVRRFGAAALDLAYVAAGRFDGYWEEPISPWDVAAGIIIVREAGGYVKDLKGTESMLENGSILATNQALFESLSKTFVSCYKD